MNYWIMKSEPGDYSIADLKKDKKTIWTGVRNYQARNFMTQEMKKGDLAFFYHSNAEPSGIAGLMKIASDKAEADPTQFDSKSDYFDPKAKPDKVIWFGAQVEFLRQFKTVFSLEEIRSIKSLKDMRLLQKGNRLSILPLTEQEYKTLIKAIDNKE